MVLKTFFPYFTIEQLLSICYITDIMPKFLFACHVNLFLLDKQENWNIIATFYCSFTARIAEQYETSILFSTFIEPHTDLK